MTDDQRVPSVLLQYMFIGFILMVPITCIVGLVALVRHDWWLVYITFILQCMNVLLGFMSWVLNVIEAGHVEKALKGGKQE